MSAFTPKIKCKIRGYINIKYRIFKGDKYFVAECNDLDIFTQGRTLTEATENIREAIYLYLNTIEEEGIREEIFREKNIKIHPIQKREEAPDFSTFKCEEKFIIPTPIC